MTALTLGGPPPAMPASLQRAWRDGVAPLLLALAALFLAANYLLPRLAGGGWNLYLAQPLLWTALGVFCLTRPGWRPERLSRSLLLLGGMCGAFHVALLAGAGLLWGFGYTTYAQQPAAMGANLLYLGTLLFGVETARGFLLARFANRPGPAFVSIALLFALLGLSLDQIGGVLSLQRESLVVAGERFLPAFATSLLATALALLGGPWTALAYRAVLLAAEWFSPFLPDLAWLPAAAVGTLAPALGLVLVLPRGSSRAAPASRRLPGWLMPLAVALLVAVWFNTGLLGVRPAIVSGISMEPSLKLGDIVITRKVDPGSIVPGDVIRFRSGEVPVLHRVVEVQRADAGLTFVTKGDNNNYLDAPVPAAAVEGKVVLVIPKAGLLPVTVKQWLAR